MKKFFFIGLSFALSVPVSAQVANWQNLDLSRDGVFGISSERAYRELLAGKKPVPVIVTIIDSGIDTTHSDLRSVLWRNIHEIPANGHDDDRNGYVDDVFGWNFTGLPISRDSVVSWIRHKKTYFDSLSFTRVPANIRPEYERFRKVTAAYERLSSKLESSYHDIEQNEVKLERLAKLTDKDDPGVSDFKKLTANASLDQFDQKVLQQLINMLPLYKGYKDFRTKTITGVKQKIRYVLDHLESNTDSAKVAAGFFDPSSNVGYDQLFTIPAGYDINDNQPFVYHGTHIAGIIGADRNNDEGVKGVANDVRIMNLKIYSPFFPDFTDEALARAIKYAADNGSRVINLSLGARTSQGKSKVDDAVRYAMAKGVLIVHGAGNSGKDLDNEVNDDSYPNKLYADGSGAAAAWLTVGASGWRDDDSLAADFSDFGRSNVDVFAPGVKILSTIPGSRYEAFSGTSMATPMVVGLAALIMEYYPKLTASQVKEVIMRSVVKVNHPVIMPGQHRQGKKLPFTDLCVSGGIINAYQALKLAATY